MTESEVRKSPSTPKANVVKTQPAESPTQSKAQSQDAEIKKYFHYSTKRKTMAKEDESEERERGTVERGRRNADLLLRGQGFLKGNKYDVVAKDEEGATSGSKEAESPVARVVDRYFTDKSTIRCRNCREFGHISTYCPNEHTQAKVCIYCASTSHEQYDCPNMLCYICNRKGHKAAQCKEPRTMKCFSCGQSGHKADACTSRAQAIPATEIEKIVCIQCGCCGHAMCDSDPPVAIPWPTLTDDQLAKHTMLERCREQLFEPDPLGDGLGLPPELVHDPQSHIQTNLAFDRVGHRAEPSKEQRLASFRKKHTLHLKKEKEDSARLTCCRCGGDHVSVNCYVLPMQLHRAHDMSVRRAPALSSPRRQPSFRENKEQDVDVYLRTKAIPSHSSQHHEEPRQHHDGGHHVSEAKTKAHHNYDKGHDAHSKAKHHNSDFKRKKHTGD